MSEVVYARIPAALKHALQDHATERGLTLTGAVVEVTQRGLEAISSGASLEPLKDKLAASTAEIGKARARLREAEVRLEAAQEQRETVARIYGAVAFRLRQELTQCPRCHKPVSGADLLTRGQCPHCGRALTSLLAPTRAGLDRDQWIALLGALGVLVGLALDGAPDNLSRSDS